MYRSNCTKKSHHRWLSRLFLIRKPYNCPLYLYAVGAQLKFQQAMAATWLRVVRDTCLRCFMLYFVVLCRRCADSVEVGVFKISHPCGTSQNVGYRCPTLNTSLGKQQGDESIGVMRARISLRKQRENLRARDSRPQYSAGSTARSSGSFTGRGASWRSLSLYHIKSACFYWQL